MHPLFCVCYRSRFSGRMSYCIRNPEMFSSGVSFVLMMNRKYLYVLPVMLLTAALFVVPMCFQLTASLDP